MARAILPRRAPRAIAGKVRASSGQSIVELALVIPLLLMILMGTIDFARAFYTKVAVTNAARVGAGVGVSDTVSNAVIQATAVAEAANSGLSITTSDVTVATVGDDLTVTVECNFSLLFPALWRDVLQLPYAADGSPIRVRGTAVTRRVTIIG